MNNNKYKTGKITNIPAIPGSRHHFRRTSPSFLFLVAGTEPRGWQSEPCP